ncbi:hydantoinase/oxoprolinase family protein [Mesorhizobium australicum]|uniref:N-methylhydantoinase A n=1 Tax=Mesorhizobium australicum TaxID=536018 RepID=A0A1X7PPT7_9HYPH|nr:hydantoinase/oxoprolinase family protein [Mesorhizobium australicum]SMH53931.1 N-methylhydantoinase A [Mesorhizobium australicum]
MTGQPELRLSADVGGTFTDMVLEQAGTRWTSKVLTTPVRPEEGVLAGIAEILEIAGKSIGDVTTFVHGTTLATNAIIERRGAKTALIATDGFRDVVEIGTESRYDQYELALVRPKPLVERPLRFTVRERMDARGNVLLALDETDVLAVVQQLKTAGVLSVAVCFLHAYANPAHELRVAALLSEHLPGVTVSLSHEVSPEIREYERTSTTIANAYVQPLMSGYLKRLEVSLRERGFTGFLCLMTSGGGLSSVESARRFPVRLVESGPAGGSIFAAQIAATLGEKKVLAFDMGGTTAKVSLIHDFQSETVRSFEVDRAARFLKGSGLPLRIPVIEMVEIGAGGGSIAGIDQLKRVTVGPESASSVPGPACYGRGGKEATVTDADLMLGLIDPKAFAGGSILLDPEKSHAAFASTVGEALSLDAEMSAYAVYEMVCENMASAARVHAVERGAVASQHTVIAFGGAAPLHVARVADKIGADRVIVPQNAGVGSAVGFLAAPISYEVVRSGYQRLDTFDAAAANKLLEAMAAEIRSWVETAARGAPLVERRIAYMRYLGQGHEIPVVIPGGTLEPGYAAAFREQFEDAYRMMFKRIIPKAAIEVMAWSVSISTEPTLPEAIEPIELTDAPETVEKRRFFDGRNGVSVDIPLYRRSALRPGQRFAGPAIVNEAETSTFVSDAFDAWIDASGAIVMQRKARAVLQQAA